MITRLFILFILVTTVQNSKAQNNCEAVSVYFTDYGDTDEIFYLDVAGLRQLSLAGYEACPNSEYHIDNFSVVVNGKSIKNVDNGFDELNQETRNSLRQLGEGDKFTVSASIRVIDEDEKVKTFTVKRVFKLVAY